MTILNLNRKCQLVMMSNDEIADWIADESPLPGDAVFNSSTGMLNYFDEDSGESKAVKMQLPVKKIDADAVPGDNEYQNDLLKSRTVLVFMRNGTGQRVVYYTPTTTQEVYHDTISGTLTLFAGQTFGTEWLSIIYSLEQPDV